MNSHEEFPKTYSIQCKDAEQAKYLETVLNHLVDKQAVGRFIEAWEYFELSTGIRLNVSIAEDRDA